MTDQSLKCCHCVLTCWKADYAHANELDAHNEEVTTFLTTAAYASMPMTKPCKVERKDGWFHEPKMEELKHRLNTVKRIFLKNMTAKN